MRKLHDDPTIMLDKGCLLLEFYARWCGTCRAVTRRIEELETEMELQGILIDVEQLPLVAKNFHIKGIPVLICLQDGIELDRISGSLEKEEIRAWLLQLI